MADNVSDHSPLEINFHEELGLKKRPFRFYEMWMADERSHVILEDALKVRTRGTTIYKLVGSLKRMKKPLKGPNKGKFRNIHHE